MESVDTGDESQGPERGPTRGDGAAGSACRPGPSGPRPLGASERALGDFTTTPAILRLIPPAILIGVLATGIALGAAGHDRLSHEPALLPTSQREARVACREPPRAAGGGDPRLRRPGGGPHGTVRVGADPRSRHPRGDGAHPHQRQPRAAPLGAPQADLERGQHRLGWPVRCRRADHPDRRCGRLHHRPAPPPDRGRAPRPPRGGCRGRDERSLRHPGGGHALRRRAPGLRVEAALHGAHRPGGGHRRWPAHGPGRCRPALAPADLPGSRRMLRWAASSSSGRRPSASPPVSAPGS